MAGTIMKMSSILLPTVLAIFTAMAMITSLPFVSAKECGQQAGGAVCTGGSCCSKWGWCGNTQDYCGAGCQSQCGGSSSPTPTPTPTTPTPSGQGVASIITEDLFNQMLKHREDSACMANGFYTYAAFLAAASAFPGFGTTGNVTTNRRELAAFLAQTSHKTTGGWSSAPDGPYAWGYCYKEQQGSTSNYCDTSFASSEWPCTSGKKYYGRGPIQITWNYNYGWAGEAIGFDGLNNPDIVANDSTVSFKTAVWFWMTAQSPRPSCHDAMTGSNDSAAGRPAGYGLVTDIITGGIGCGIGNDRIGFYKRYCDILGVSYGSNLDCNTTKNLTAPSTNSTSPSRSTNLTVPSTNLTAPPGSTNLTAQPRNLTRSSGKTSFKIVPVLLGSGGGIALIVVLCLVFGRRRHWTNCVRTDANLAAREDFGQVLFDYKVLRDSTGNFDRKNILGKGGFGEVYKGRLPDGRVVAVKKLNGKQTSQAAEEFLTEVKLITNLRHRNLVRLLGCCTRGHKRLLVYEFMSNNSLDKHLFGEIRNALSWDNRLNIIVGTARGLAYLHGDSDVRIVHRDIKCANILLDDRFHPKISDFGLAKCFPEDQTHVSTRVGGTIGYTAPEYAVHGQLTEKADVYSYGIVVLEIVSGRKCVDARLPAPLQLLLEWAWNLFPQDQVLDIVDSSLDGQYPREQALRIISIALLCTQGSWALRPAMSEVVYMLTNSSEIIAEPTRPAFIDAPADRPANITPIPDSGTSAAAPPQRSHGSISVSLLPR